MKKVVCGGVLTAINYNNYCNYYCSDVKLIISTIMIYILRVNRTLNYEWKLYN
jgi:hypothetical protein